MTPTPSAYFLVAHGSRSPQSQQSLNQLAHFFETRLQAKQKQSVWVGSGCLEFQEQSLAGQLLKFIDQLPTGIQKVRVLPVFLLPGNHVRGDIPEEIQAVQKQLLNTSSSVKVELTPHIGSHPELKDLLQEKMKSHKADHWVLLGHGSKREEGNQAIRRLAHSIQAHPAFWAVQPSFSTVIQELEADGKQTIGVLPYFLFAGKITQTIEKQASELSTQYPDLEIFCSQPLAPSEKLADLLIDLGQTSEALSTEWQSYAQV